MTIQVLEELTSEINFSDKPSKLYESSLLIFLYSLQGLVIGIILETMQMNLKSSFG